ncbi:response regulator [Magnetococcus sp. PR-3]|uniref:response regulator n=1 Tax=Magnetococcus sp. PR-3 TaxID=3120355 RepID=UPI002FCDE6F9
MSDKARILVVDDAPENIAVISNTLKEDYTILAATRGEKALEIAAKTPSPDLILLDIMMPGMDGYEVCRRLKSAPATRSIPIIFLTSKDTILDEAKGLMLGAVDYMMKPVDATLVKARIRAHLMQQQMWKKREANLLDHILRLEAKLALQEIK